MGLDSIGGVQSCWVRGSRTAIIHPHQWLSSRNPQCMSNPSKGNRITGTTAKTRRVITPMSKTARAVG